MSFQHRQGGPPRAQAVGPTDVQVTTNMFEIKRVPNKKYFQYDAFQPDVAIPRKRQEIITKLQNVVAPNLFSPRGLYDGKAIMFISHELLLGSGGTGRITVSLRSDNNLELGKPGVYEVKLTRTVSEPIKPADIKSLTVNARSTGSSPKLMMATNLLQLLVSQAANQKHPHNRSAYFSSTNSKKLTDGLELWRGYFQSVRPTLKKLLVNVDTTMSAVYQSGPLIDVILSFLNVQDARSLILNEHDFKLHRLESFLKNVLINVESTKNKTKTIRGIVPRAGQFVFQKDGQPMTVEQYFHDAYNIRLRFPNIVGVRLSGKNAEFPIVVPAELCIVLPGQLYKKKLPDHLTSTAVTFSALKPSPRLDEILKNQDSPVKRFSSDEFIIESGMQISTTPETINGKLLPPPALMFGQNSGALNPSRGAWNVVGKKFFEAMQLHRWIVVNFCSSRFGQEVTRLVQSLAGCCHELGMDVRRDPPIVAANPQGNIAQALTSAVIDAAGKGKYTPPQTQLVLVILPEKADTIRAQVKFWGDCDKGVITQCLRESKVRKANNQYCNNVALKINARLGGRNSITTSTVLQNLASAGPFMIIGADVSHSGPGVHKPSIASIVWSVDREATSYHCISCVQHPRAEIITNLDEMVKIAITSFGSVNKVAPARIIFYRDGVSEGEFSTVGKTEITAIQNAIASLWAEKKAKEPQPKLTFIVVGKRHHLTFYTKRNLDTYDNCAPGFATNDSELQNPLVPDFYLQSHSAIQGTSRSSHYILLHDEIFNNDIPRLQTLSFDLCHVYAKATRSVSIPAPVYYADLACSRGPFHFSPDSQLNMGGSDDASSVASGSDFNLDPWRQAFGQVKLRGMFFL